MIKGFQPIILNLQVASVKEECEQALAAKLTLESVPTSLLLADKHNCSTLKAKCEQFLINNLRADLVASSLLLADSHKCKKLKEAALNFCSTQTDFIMKDKVHFRSHKSRKYIHHIIFTVLVEDGGRAPRTLGGGDRNRGACRLSFACSVYCWHKVLDHHDNHEESS